MQNIIEDETMFEVVFNPLWPSSHSGYQYRPFDISWRPDNVEIYHSLMKVPPAIQLDATQSKKQFQAMNIPTVIQPINNECVQTVNVYGQLFFEQSSQQDSFQEVKKQIENSGNLFRTVQLRVIENMIRFMGEFHQIPFVMQEHMNQVLQNYDFQRTKKLYPYIALSQALNLFHRTMAQHNAMNPLVLDHSHNNQLLHDVLDIFQKSETESAFLFKYYSATNKLDTGFLVPKTEKQMLFNPILHGYLLVKLYKANVLRQLGFLQQANLVYQELLVLSTQNTPGNSYPLFVNSFPMHSVATCKYMPQSTSTTIESSFPDVRVPFILNQFALGNGANLLKQLLNGVFNDYGEEQIYFHENFCHAVCYFDEYYKNPDTRDFISEDSIDTLRQLNGRQLNQRYQQLTSVRRYFVESRIDCNCICCSGEGNVGAQRQNVQIVCSNQLQNAVVKIEQKINPYGNSTVSNFACQTNNLQVRQRDLKYNLNRRQIINPISQNQKFRTKQVKSIEQKPDDILVMQSQPQFSYNCEYQLPALIPQDSFKVGSLQQENQYALAMAEDTGAHYAPLREMLEDWPSGTQKVQGCQFENLDQNSFDTLNTSFNLKLNQQMLAPAENVYDQSSLFPDFSLIKLIIESYKKSDNPNLLNVPISRFLYFGEYQQSLEINVDFNKTTKLFSGSGKVDQFINSQFFNKNGDIYTPFLSSTALYSTILLMLNKRAIWANQIANIINKSEILSRCCCGSCVQLIPKNLSPNILSCGIALKCGDLDNFIKTLIRQYPPPGLPSLNLLYAAFSSNSVIPEYLLGYRRLPDVATLRMFITLFGEQQQFEMEAYKFQKSKKLNLNKTPYLGIAKTQMNLYQASLYVSDFGHFWQSDLLINEIEELAKKIEIAGGQTVKSRMGFSSFNQAHQQLFSQTNEYIQYSALDFLNQTYKAFIEFEMVKSLNTNNLMNLTYCDQMYHIYKMNNNDKTGINDDIDEQCQMLSDLSKKFKHNNMFQISDLYINLQTFQHFKATLYSFVFDKLMQSQIQKIYEENQLNFSPRSITNIQLIFTRFLGEILYILPELKVFPIIKSLYWQVYQQIGSTGYQSFMQAQQPISAFTGELLNVVVQQLTKLIQDFMFTQSQAKVQRTISKKDKPLKKKPGAPQNQQQNMQTSHLSNQNNTDDFIIREDDSMFQMFKINTGLCLNFVLNQNISNRNQFVACQLVQLQQIPTQQFILQQVAMTFQQKINALTSTESIYVSPSMNSKDDKQVCGILINQFNQFTDISSFYQLLQSQLSIHHYNLEQFISSRFFKQLVQIISHYNLDNHFIAIFSMLFSIKSFIKNMLQLSDGIPNFDYNGYILTTVEKFTGNNLFDLTRSTSQINSDPQKVTSLNDLVQMFTLNNNNVQFQVKSVNQSQNYIYSSVPSSVHYCLLNCDRQKLNNLQDLLDNFLKYNFVAENQKSIDMQSQFLYSTLNPFYISTIMGNTQMFYLIQFFYNYSFQEYMQALNIAAQQCNLSMLHILFNDNDEPSYYKDESLSQHISSLNEQRSQVTNFNIPSIDSYFIQQLVNDQSNDTQKLYQQRMVDLHSVMTAYFTDENFPESHSPVFHQQKFRSDKKSQFQQQLYDVQININKLQIQLSQTKGSQEGLPAISDIERQLQNLNNQKECIQQGLMMVNNFYIFHNQQDIENKDRIFKSVQLTMSMSLYFQMNLFLQIIFNNSRFCENNECYTCKYNNYITDYLLRTGKKQTEQQNTKCIAQQQILRTMDATILSRNILNEFKNATNFINQQICNNIQQSMLFLLSRKDFSQLYVIIDQLKYSNQASDLLYLKNQFLISVSSNVQFIPLSTPLIIAAQCNSEALISLTANIQSTYQAYGKQHQSILLQFFNHDDYYGFTAVHHAMICFLRLGQSLINFQGIVDKFNQSIQNKYYVAKFIQKLKTQFKQSFFNLQCLLGVDFVQTFKASADGISLRERLFQFLFQNQLITGQGIQALLHYKESQKEDFSINYELLFQIFGVTNDALLRNQIEKGYEQHLSAIKDQSKENIQQIAQLMKSTSHSNIMKKYQNQFSFYLSSSDQSKHSQRKQKIQQIINQINNQNQNFLGLGKTLSIDNIGITLNLNLHGTIMKFQQSTDPQTLYNSNDLIKIVVVELVNIIRLLMNDEKPPAKDFSHFFLNSANKYQMLQTSLPSALYSVEQSKDQQVYNCQTGTKFLGIDLCTKPELVSFAQLDISDNQPIQFQIMRYSTYLSKTTKDRYEQEQLPEYMQKQQKFVQYIEYQIFNKQLQDLVVSDTPPEIKDFPHQVIHMRADSKLFQCIKAKKSGPAVGQWVEHFQQAIPEISISERQIQQICQKMSKLDQITCNLQNTIRFSYRLFRLFNSCEFSAANEQKNCNFLLQHVTKIGPPLHLSLLNDEHGVPKLSKIEDDFSLLEWRRITTRVQNRFYIMGQNKVVISILPESGCVSMKQCLNYYEGCRILDISTNRISHLVDNNILQFEQQPKQPAIINPPFPVINNEYCMHFERTNRKDNRVFSFLSANSRYQTLDSDLQIFKEAEIEHQRKCKHASVSIEKAEAPGFKSLDEDESAQKDSKTAANF